MFELTNAFGWAGWLAAVGFLCGWTATTRARSHALTEWRKTLDGWKASNERWMAIVLGNMRSSRLSKESVEEAASSLFITDGGGEAFQLVLREKSGDAIGVLRLPDVTDLLCHHLGVKE